ncbi:MAG: EamA family transporter [Gemmatimonadota bacterium]
MPDRQVGPPAEHALRTGVLLTIAAASMWGISGVVMKQIMRDGIAPRALLVLRLGGSAIVTGLLILLWRPRAFNLPRRFWVTVLVLGGFLASLQYLYFLTVRATNVGTAVFLEYLAPAFIVTWGWTQRRQSFDRWSASAVITALAGSFLLVAGGGELSVPRAALITGLGAAFTLTVQALLIERLLLDLPPLTVFFYAMVAGAAASLVLGTPVDAVRAVITPAGLKATMFVVLFSTIIPFLLQMNAVARIGAGKTAVINTLEPAVAGIVAWPVLGESLRPVQWAGGVLIGLAVVLIGRSPGRVVASALPIPVREIP